MVKRIEAPAGDVQDVTAKPSPAAPGVAPEVVAGLDGLLSEAGAAEKQGRAQEQQAAEKQEQQQVDTLEADLIDALNMAAAPARPAMWWLTEEQFEQLWGAKVRKGIAESGAIIMRRHGLSLGGLMNQYGPYVGLVAALGPSLAGTVAIYKAEKQRQLQGAANGGGKTS